MDPIAILQYDWAFRALAASAMVGVLCGALGCFIVLRNMALIGDALSHAILPGVVFAFIFIGSYSTLGFFIGSVIAGLLSAVAITWIQQNVQTKNDAAIGIVFTAMFSIGIMGISRLNNVEGVHLDLKDFLFGNVLGISDSDLWLTGIVTIFVLACIYIFYRYLFISTFQPTIADTMGIKSKWIHYFLMLLLSFSIVASFQTVGVILVVAMLITPPSTAILWSDKLYRVIIASSMIGLFSAVIGFYAAVYLDTTPGPAMAVSAALIYLVSIFIAPQKGLISRTMKKRKLVLRIRQEDILKETLRSSQRDQKVTVSMLQEKLHLSARQINSLVAKLSKAAFVRWEGKNHLVLTESGKNRATGLMRAHRLWETYLVNQIGLAENQIHQDAENLEHHLTDELLDEVDQALGYPREDPHGSPIPKKISTDGASLSDADLGETVVISMNQPNPEIISFLWDHGLVPGQEIKITERNMHELHVLFGDSQFDIPVQVAQYIAVDEAE